MDGNQRYVDDVLQCLLHSPRGLLENAIIGLAGRLAELDPDPSGDLDQSLRTLDLVDRALRENQPQGSKYEVREASA
jgi:hypothetical protein